MSILQLEGVSLCYRLARQRIPSLKEYAIHLVKGALSHEQLWALRDIDLEVGAGEVVGIVGRNGAGKSTLLKVISGILKPTRGRAQVHGTVAPLLELGTGFDYELTGEENIYLNALLLGHSRREIVERYHEIVAFSELEEFVYSPLRNYSSGMVARLGFAIATAWPSAILILDEVLSVGDAAFQQRCFERLRALERSGTTVLTVSHSSTAIQEQCPRCVWLDHGRIMADGPTREVLAAYANASGLTSAEQPLPALEPVR